MNNNCCAKSIIISTYVDQSTKRTLLPHFKHISLRNPSSDIHIVVGKDAPQGKKYNWRNGDKPLFYWWQKNKQKVKGDVIALIEWDTFMSCPIPELPNDLDLAGRTMFLENPNIRNKWKPKGMKAPNWSVDNWAWWNEVEHFNLKNNQTAVGLISFGFFLIRKSLLDCVFSSKWLHLYEKDIISELRLPTIANLEGARIGEIHLPFVDHLKMEIGDTPGIYHPIKHRVDS